MSAAPPGPGGWGVGAQGGGTDARPWTRSPLVDVSEANGSTELVPESHRSDMEPLPSVVMDLPAGSALLFDYRLYHRAIPNRSQEVRPILYATVARDWFEDAARDWPAGACDRFRRLPT